MYHKPAGQSASVGEYALGFFVLLRLPALFGVVRVDHIPFDDRIRTIGRDKGGKRKGPNKRHQNADGRNKIIQSEIHKHNNQDAEDCHQVALNAQQRKDQRIFNDFDVNEEMSSFKLIDVIEKGSTFTHEYDFGSTTTLKIKVVDKYTGINSLKDISLLARNNKKEFICEKCEKDATYFLTDYEYSDYQLLCDDCIKNLSDDEVEETLFIKITNSPRMGICGYTGENDVYELE